MAKMEINVMENLLKVVQGVTGNDKTSTALAASILVAEIMSNLVGEFHEVADRIEAFTVQLAKLNERRRPRRGNGKDVTIEAAVPIEAVVRKRGWPKGKPRKPKLLEGGVQ